MKLEQHNVQQRVAFLAAIMLGCVIGCSWCRGIPWANA